MEIKFEANQPHQLEAIRSAIDVFVGQPQVSAADFAFGSFGSSSLELTEAGLANRRVITDSQFLSNIRSVQERNGLPPSEKLEYLLSEDGAQITACPNITTEMETGTGKTYVYLRTIHELHKTYGFKKFVVVVPSVAIREGVLKTIAITRSHFQSLYNYERFETLSYESSRVALLRNFALSNALEILVISIDAFARDVAIPEPGSGRSYRGNVINQVRESGIRPIEFIQAANPVVILDEPQNMETAIRKQAIGRLNPLCILRYSATPRQAYNMLYRLDPIRAYELGLVKRISVDSVVEASDPNRAFVEVEGFNTSSRSISAKLRIWVTTANGPIKKSVVVKNGDDLYLKSKNREIYRDGFVVNEIDASSGIVRFANDVAAHRGATGSSEDTVLRLQIESTVRRHFEKARILQKHGIKVLSLFFIDRVANYRSYDETGGIVKGKLATWFEEIFLTYSHHPEFSGLVPFEPSQVHAGYFSQDKQGRVRDSTERSALEDKDTYDLIMRDKERLLDLAEPVQFIFSHSALREGWDNPNVFQICTLSESVSLLKKRQEIGRGLRLAVNANGERVFDTDLNQLTIVANESYDEFARGLQSEFEEAGLEFDKRMVRNEREKVTVRLRKGYQADERFKELWDRIRLRTRYRVRYSSAAIVDESVKRVNKMDPIAAPHIMVTRSDITVGSEGVRAVEVGRRTTSVTTDYVIPDIVAEIERRTSLSKGTIAKIVLGSQRLGDALNDPQLFIERVSDQINVSKRDLLAEGVEYIKVDGMQYEMRRFELDDYKEVFKSNAIEVRRPEKTLFSHIIIDANSGPERSFAEACENNEDVSFYIKLPRWFQIDTPVGPYTPDWALVYNNGDALYFVAETKRTGGKAVQPEMLRPLEQIKIECGKRHFKDFDGVQFKVVESLSQLIL